jgi:hypothetical protein
MLVNLLTSPDACKKVFHIVYCIIPAHSVASLKNNRFAKHPNARGADLRHAIPYLRASNEERRIEEKLLVKHKRRDDSLKNSDVQMLVYKLFYNRRHYRLSIICLVQSYNAMHLAIRKTISHLASYKPRNKKGISTIWEELIFLYKEAGEALQRFVFDRPCAFLLTCANTNELYNKFNRVLI